MAELNNGTAITLVGPDPNPYGFTELQKEWLVMIPRFSGSISFCCSALIVYIILSNRKTKLSHIYQRLLLGMSTADMLFSSSNFLIGWAPNYQGTCTLYGFLSQFSPVVFLYNASLTSYFMLVICYEWSPKKFHASRVEWVMHGVSLGWPILAGIAAIATQSYGKMTVYPGTCSFDEYPDGRANENNRNAAALWLEIFGNLLPSVVGFFVVTFTMTRICWVVFRQEQKHEKYNFRSSTIGQQQQQQQHQRTQGRMRWRQSFSITGTNYQRSRESSKQAGEVGI